VTVSFRRLEIAVAAALFLLGAFATFEATKMPFGTAALPGPAMMPLALGVLIMLCSAGLIVLELRKPAEAELVPLGNRHVAVGFVAIVAAGLAFERVGFVITSTLFLFALLVSLSTLGWWRSMLAAVAASLATGFVFRNLLGVNLPPIPFGT
jgi:putative tricarboxylic transport membrane protein